MTKLKFEGEDLHGLIDVLIEAIRVTSTEGKRPSVEVNGKTYAPYDLTKVALLLPHDEPLEEHHAAAVAKIFAKKQRGYGRTAWNLAHLYEN